MTLKPWPLMAAAALALFAGLGSRALWEDEAETALLARRVLSHGLPYAGGPEIISQLHQNELGWDGLWTWTPWAQVYLAAASLAVFGQSAWGARALFSLTGLLGLWVFFKMARYFFRQDERLSLLALFFAAACVPLLLHLRQCRWYAPAFLEFVLWWWGYWKLMEGDKGGKPLLILGMTGLFYTQQMTFAAAALSLAASHLLFNRRKTAVLLGPVLVSAALCLPWLFLQTHFTTPAFPGGPGKRLAFYLIELNAHHIPFILLAGWLALARPREPRVLFALVFLGGYLLALAAGPYPYFYRYLIPVLPVCLLVQAALSGDLLRYIPVAAFLAVFAGTNLFSMALPSAGHGELQSPWISYLEELILPYKGPISSLARYLNDHAKPGDAVWISYGDLPLRFHTPLRVYGGLTGVNFAALPRPDWVILRAQTMAGRIGWDRMLALHVAKTLDIKEYRRIILDSPDAPWENRPEPDEHRFTTPSGYPPVVLFQRR